MRTSSSMSWMHPTGPRRSDRGVRTVFTEVDARKVPLNEVDVADPFVVERLERRNPRTQWFPPAQDRESPNCWRTSAGPYRARGAA